MTDIKLKAAAEFLLDKFVRLTLVFCLLILCLLPGFVYLVLTIGLSWLVVGFIFWNFSLPLFLIKAHFCLFFSLSFLIFVGGLIEFIVFGISKKYD